MWSCRRAHHRTLPRSATDPPDRSAVVPSRIDAAQPAGETAARRLFPRHPIDEEDDVPGLLAHQHVEDLEKPFGQEAGPAGDLEDAKTEKRIEAFAITKIGKGPAQITAEWFVERTLFGSDAIAPDHLAQQLGVARLFEPLEGDRVAHQRVGDRLGVGVDNGTRSPFARVRAHQCVRLRGAKHHQLRARPSRQRSGVGKRPFGEVGRSSEFPGGLLCLDRGGARQNAIGTDIRMGDGLDAGGACKQGSVRVDHAR